MRAYKVLSTKRYFEYGGDFIDRNFFIIFPEIKVKIPLNEGDLRSMCAYGSNNNGFSFFNNARRFDETDSDFDRLNDSSIEEWRDYMEGKQGILDTGWEYMCEPMEVDDEITDGLLRKIETDEQMISLDDKFKRLFLESVPS